MLLHFEVFASPQLFSSTGSAIPWSSMMSSLLHALLFTSSLQYQTSTNESCVCCFMLVDPLCVLYVLNTVETCYKEISNSEFLYTANKFMSSCKYSTMKV